MFKAEARLELRKVPRERATAILRRLAELETGPFAFGAAALVGAPGRRRLRVGDYRVVYTVDNGQLIIVVVQVGRRSTIYD
ncbi:hypothetical protein GCM10007079_45280 [Nocardiopsis terrae]|nr:hypothetical protein GCM10007079_45280 [Nocardiopsis terrae]